jgi:dephospho-CoA kinase
LTGPIGCGKSTVAGWLAAKGVQVVDADAVARDVTEPGQPAFAAIVERFGPAVRRADGGLDRRHLADIVFADADALAALEAIVHPAVRPRIMAAIAAAEAGGAAAVAVEAIRLVESGLAALCDEVWLVVCPPVEQRRRLAGRGMDEADATRRIAAQGAIVDRLGAHASRVIDTSGPTSGARARVEAALRDALGKRG